MKTFIVGHQHYETPGFTQVYGPYTEEDAQDVKSRLDDLTSAVYGSGEWVVVPCLMFPGEAP